jgi:enamine deaminase RidA (YjgF/YER057c/UK114 family)
LILFPHKSAQNLNDSKIIKKINLIMTTNINFPIMKNLTVLLVISSLILSCASENSNDQSSSGHDVYERLEANGIELVEPGPPVANFVYAVRAGNLIFLSGHGPDRPDGSQVTGKMGTGELTLEEGQEAARLTGISLLASLQQKIGDLNKVTRIVKVNGMVNADSSFTQHSQVINGFSDLMVDLFGDNGSHARASVGMSSLPGNIAVEIDMVVEVRD